MTLQNMLLRIPVIVRAVVIGFLVTAAMTVPWAMLVSVNLKHWPAIPWSALVTAPLLWFYWKYLTVPSRRANLRVQPLSSGVWGMSLMAGMIGLGALLAFQAVLARLVSLPPEQEKLDLSNVPALTLLILVVMGSVVAGVTEEAGFRGYMQGMIERRHGLAIAILVSGTVFGFAHFSHRNVSFGHLPYYIAISAVFGMLAYLTGSIMPGLVLHAFGDTFEGVLLVASGRSTWPESAESTRLVWESGPDLAFWGLCAWAMLWILGAVAAYRALAHEVRTEGRVMTARTIAEVR